MEGMNEHKNQIFQDPHHHHHKSYGFTTNSDLESIKEMTKIFCESSSSSSISSCSSLDTADDASSLTSSSSSSSSLDLSDLTIHLPIKRGLSKFYDGQSRSFTSLASVRSIEDLPKYINNPYNNMRKMKMKANSKSYGGGLDNYKSHTLPKPIISKKLSPFLRQRSFARSTLVNKMTNDNI